MKNKTNTKYQEEVNDFCHHLATRRIISLEPEEIKPENLSTININKEVNIPQVSFITCASLIKNPKES